MERKQSIYLTIVGWVEIVVGSIVAIDGLVFVIYDIIAALKQLPPGAEAKFIGLGIIFGISFLGAGLFIITAGRLLLKSDIRGKFMTASVVGIPLFIWILVIIFRPK